MKTDIYTSGEYLKNNPTWDIEHSPWKAGYILDILKKNGLSPSSVCEIGCGAGGILTELAGRMPESVSFTGYEISPQAYELAKTKENGRIKFILKDITADKDAFFDIALVIDVVEHVQDYIGFLKAIKPRSEYKVFHIPLDMSVQAAFRPGRLLKEKNDVGHLHYFSRETALASLTDSGYTVLDCFYTASAVELPARSVLNMLARLPRKALFAMNKDLSVRLLGGYSLMVLAK